jgi:hypothetical protein
MGMTKSYVHDASHLPASTVGTSAQFQAATLPMVIDDETERKRSCIGLGELSYLELQRWAEIDSQPAEYAHRSQGGRSVNHWQPEVCITW